MLTLQHIAIYIHKYIHIAVHMEHVCLLLYIAVQFVAMTLYACAVHVYITCILNDSPNTTHRCITHTSSYSNDLLI